ncbi:hypothetical protein DMC30DRAFT_266404 [Rhodotorula diobovata]|uniref:Uncharacterized protein n=1 Tax=Rhodotorula diobovata TaxID=5288 RepID=A0A5C5FV44_9BASI|nr:hypothetical protein DMC30DRAFT_266404 [Rhodotorula diobovata]
MADDAYPPYQSRPSMAPSDVDSTTAPGYGPLAPYRAGSAVGTNGDGRYLQAAQDIELTKEDRQEGYDATLLNLPERNTAAPAPAQAPERGFLPSSRPPGVLAAALPYASRARDTSLDDDDEHKRRSGGAGAPRKKGVRHDAASAGHDHVHRSRGSGGGAAARGGSTSRRRGGGKKRKQQLKWWQKPVALGALLALLLVVGLAVGLGVGLTQGKKKSDSKASTAGVSSSGFVPGGIQPSQSSNGGGGGGDVQVSASTAATDRVGALTMQPTAAADVEATPTVAVAAARVTTSALLEDGGSRRAARWV